MCTTGWESLKLWNEGRDPWGCPLQSAESARTSTTSSTSKFRMTRDTSFVLGSWVLDRPANSVDLGLRGFEYYTLQDYKRPCTGWARRRRRSTWGLAPNRSVRRLTISYPWSGSTLNLRELRSIARFSAESCDEFSNVQTFASSVTAAVIEIAGRRTVARPLSANVDVCPLCAGICIIPSTARETGILGLRGGKRSFLLALHIAKTIGHLIASRVADLSCG